MMTSAQTGPEGLGKPRKDRVTAVLAEDARRKSGGIHYTPPVLAAYVAQQIVLGLQQRHIRVSGIAVLDPACGEGELLRAVVDAVPASWRSHLLLTGFDKDENALSQAKKTLRSTGVGSVTLHCADFLSAVSASNPAAQMNLGFASERSGDPLLKSEFDAVISNPPYVRTQVLGAAAARQLAVRFELTGRIDLYHAFVKAMTLALRQGGMLGLLTSNRYLSVQSGVSMREWLLRHFELTRLVDLGDTKLFEAAILPAVLIARRNADLESQNCEFIRVYETVLGAGEAPREAHSILETLDGSFTGCARVNGTCFRVETGRLQTGADNRAPWSMTNDGIASWLATMKRHSAGTFADVAKVCVGIKTTADSIFIRDDWNTLPENERPEVELLHPLVTHHQTTRWRLPASTSETKRVLYPYATASERRTPVNLADYPRAGAYLLKHRERLQSRSYVLESGRQWYEIWVPHRPGDWTRPKLAFPDISETSKFFIVEEGWIVNGDCYWTKLLPGKDASWLLLMLAVANSSFAMKFYDAVFHNKLYSGRRRFMSQYVSRFPLPKMGRAGEILDLMPRVLRASSEQDWSELKLLQEQLDGLVWKAFGLPKEIAR
jgi:methylase of polypeptide subunit release factors